MRRILGRAPFVSGGFAIAVGAIVMVGWWSGLSRLISVVPGLPATTANAAVMALLMGASLILWAPSARAPISKWRGLASQGCAVLAAGLAAVTLAEYVLGLGAGFDQLLVSTSESLVGDHPGRPSPQTAVAYLLAAAALLLLRSGSARHRWLAERLAIASALIPLAAILGYLFGAAALYGVPSLLPYVSMSIPTALVLLALGAGIVASAGDGGLLSILARQDSGGTAARHLAAWALVLAPMVCVIAVGARLGLYAAPIASALVVLVGTVAGGAFVLRLSWLLSRLDAKRTQAQGQLRQAHERVELALRGADLASWDWNIESGEVIFSPRWAELRGHRLDEIAPHVDSWIAGVHPEDLPRVKQALEDYFEGRAAEYETEHRVRTKSGQWIWILDRGKVFARDERGRPIRMTGTELDITLRKRLEAERAFLDEVGSTLASSLELEATLASVGRLMTRALADVCVVYVVDEERGPRRVKAVTRDPSQGWISEVLMQRAAIDRRRVPAIWAELEAHRSVVLEHVSPEMLASFAQDEDHARAVRAMNMSSVVMVPLVAHGRLVGAMSMISSDPSRAYTPVEIRFAEQIAQRAAFAVENARLYDEARRAIQARDDVLGVVAHDLRNPLGSILLQAELLRHPNAETSRRPADMIERSARRMNRLIQDLLDVTRMEAGRLSVELSRIAAGQLVGEVVDGQRALAGAASLELRVEVAPGSVDAWADRDRLQQVLENLIGNAVKFTDPGGTISVGAAPRQAEILFWVADTGAGIAGEDLPRVFDRFWQAGQPGRRGAGLGLAITKGIVEAHGGRIWVESTPGRGSTFFFTLPRALGAEEHPALHAS